MTVQSGLTLLELILALTILSIILLAGTSLGLDAMRFTGRVAEEVRLQKLVVQYVVRHMELNLRDGKSAQRAQGLGCAAPVPALEDWCVSVTVEQSGVPTAIVSYLYESGAKRISWQRVGGADPTGSLLSLSEGVLVPRKDNANNDLPIFEVTGKNSSIVRVQLAAEKQWNGLTVRVPGAAKSILLRGGT